MQLTTSYHEKGRLEGKKEGKKEGIKESIIDLLSEKDDYLLFKEKVDIFLAGQKDMETLKIYNKKAARAQSVQHFLEG